MLATDLLGAAGGVGVYLVPLGLIRALGTAQAANALGRSRAVGYAMVGILCLSVALYLAFESAWVAVGAILVVLAIRVLKPNRKKQVADIVVEENLLDGAMNGRLAAGLAELEAQARAGSLSDTDDGTFGRSQL